MKKTKNRIMMIVTIIGISALLLFFIVSNLLRDESNTFTEKEIRTVQACWPAYTFETAVEEANMIIHGKVTDVSDTLVHIIGTAGNGSVMRECYKEITVDVIEGIKGVDEETTSITFIQTGGETEDYVYVVTGIVPVEIEKEYIFFINEKGSSLSPRTLIPVADGVAQTAGKIVPTTSEISEISIEKEQESLEEYNLKQYILEIRDMLE